jgi:hypothetical protein
LVVISILSVPGRTFESFAAVSCEPTKRHAEHPHSDGLNSTRGPARRDGGASPYRQADDPFFRRLLRIATKKRLLDKKYIGKL